MNYVIKWNVSNPKKINNYLCDLGALGVSLCWWDGENWIQMWTSNLVKVYGWIDIPIYD
jgi:hypothetical protein